MPRRGENIYKRKDGRWEARYVKLHDESGRAVYGYLYRRSYTEVKKAQTQARNDCAHREQGEIQSAVHKLSLTEYMKNWMQSIQMSVKKSTYANYNGLIHRHIDPVLGTMPIEKVNNAVIQKFINQKLQSGRLDGKGGLSVKTARDISGILKRSLASAGIAIHIMLPKYASPKLHVLTREEQSALIRAAEGENSTTGLGVMISLLTGIRIGELCSLKWGDVLFEKGLIKIEKTLQRIPDCRPGGAQKTRISIDTPKSNSSIREIPLPGILAAHLLKLKKDVRSEDYLLSGNRKYVEPRLCQYRFKKFIRAAGIEDINYHALRHTFATRCVELGADVKTVSELLGHSNVNITLNRYVHPTFESRKDCVERLAAVFNT